MNGEGDCSMDAAAQRPDIGRRLPKQPLLRLSYRILYSWNIKIVVTAVASCIPHFHVVATNVIAADFDGSVLVFNQHEEAVSFTANRRAGTEHGELLPRGFEFSSPCFEKVGVHLAFKSRIVRPTGSHSRRRVLQHQTGRAWIQFTRSSIANHSSRRFGMDAELCGCAVLGALLSPEAVYGDCEPIEQALNLHHIHTIPNPQSALLTRTSRFWINAGNRIGEIRTTKTIGKDRIPSSTSVGCSHEAGSPPRSNRSEPAENSTPNRMNDTTRCANAIPLAITRSFRDIVR
jgi:hypothetical protein